MVPSENYSRLSSHEIDCEYPYFSPWTTFYGERQNENVHHLSVIRAIVPRHRIHAVSCVVTCGQNKKYFFVFAVRLSVSRIRSGLAFYHQNRHSILYKAKEQIL